MIILDAEIELCIPQKNEPLTPHGYCKGWDDFRGMGCSTTCCYDFSTGRYHVFLKDNRSALQELIDKTDLVAGFNNVGFDNLLLEATWEITGLREKSYDILAEIWKSLKGRQAGFGLEKMIQANFGIGKSGSGGDAPKDWQDGKYGKVISYCLEDVRITKLLLDRIIKSGELINPKTLQPMQINKPNIA